MDFELFKKAKKGDREARNKIIEQNIGLAVSIAVRFISRYNNLELEDLIQEGLMGLITAVDRFDCTRGYKFSTYASYFIQQKIQRYIQKQTKLLHFPASAHKKINRIFAAKTELEQTNGKYSLNEISSIVGLKMEEIAELLNLANSAVSLNQPAQNTVQEAGEEIINLIPDTKTEIDREIIQRELRYFLEEALKTLPKKDQEILKMRYGFYGRRMTLSEAGSVLGITKQYVEKIEKRAVQRLKNNNKVRRMLIDFLE